MSNDELIIDLSDYQDTVGSRVLPGRYRVLVEDASITKSANSGNTMVVLSLRVQGGEFGGSVLVDRLVQAKTSMFRTVGFMQAIGLATPKKRLAINLRQFVGKLLEVDVEDGDPYMGRIKSEVRGYNRVQVGSTADNVAADILSDDPWSVPGEPEPTPESEFVADDGDDGAVDLDSVDLG